MFCTLQSPICQSQRDFGCSPSHRIHGDGSGVDELGVKEHSALGAVQPSPLDPVHATVRPEHGPAQVIHGQALGADQPCWGTATIREFPLLRDGRSPEPLERRGWLWGGDTGDRSSPELMTVSGSEPGSSPALLMALPATSVQ